MRDEKAKRALNKFLTALEARLNVHAVYLCGSHAKDTATDTSDLDLIVVSDDFSNMNDETRYGLLYNELDFPDADIFALTKQEFKGMLARPAFRYFASGRKRLR